ncbi:hypothetical protein LTR37_020394 [Vermiconidia calcicola]|uniref:Uncharacterized protein n=1 Tax=Vermiconidia calcicola TaxID=1690605 RepID=A0ACC3MBN4_9PEZI|nr:hypothetical protein LTR37_020394 [Vermiconidia calcicola]
MLFRRSKKIKAEEDRRHQREVANLHHRFFKLPAELRNQIYELVVPVGREIKRSQNFYARSQDCRLPTLLQLCRRAREEVLPLFYGRNLVVIDLQHMTLHRLSTPRMKSSSSLLPPEGTATWRKIRIKSRSRCFHADGFAVLANIDIFIDRSSGIITARPQGQKSLSKCCQDAQHGYAKRLSAEIRKAELQDRERKLRRQDFERLARRVDENKEADNFMAPQRMMPSWEERVGRFHGR